MSIVVRQATEDDLAALAALCADLHPDDPVLPHEQAVQVWRQIAGQLGRMVLIALHDGLAAGTADGIIVPNLTRGGRPFMLVENVVVAPAARRRGIASRLLDTLIDRARHAGCYKVQLLSRVDRADAHTFYETRGLRPTAQGYRLYLD